MVELLGEIMEHGLTPDLRDRAIVVLTTIGNRNNETPHLSVNRSIPEFHAPGAT
jgi:hypothetical protein